MPTPNEKTVGQQPRPEILDPAAAAVVVPGLVTPTPRPTLRTAPDGQLLPTIEIYRTQLDVIIRQGFPITQYTLSGACYDRNFSGRILIVPESPGSCNVLFNGQTTINNASFGGNSQIQIQISLFSNQRTGLQFLPCRLRYQAFHRYFLNGVPVEENVAMPNAVSFNYRVKKP